MRGRLGTRNRHWGL